MSTFKRINQAFPLGLPQHLVELILEQSPIPYWLVKLVEKTEEFNWTLLQDQETNEYILSKYVKSTNSIDFEWAKGENLWIITIQTPNIFVQFSGGSTWDILYTTFDKRFGNPVEEHVTLEEVQKRTSLIIETL